MSLSAHRYFFLYAPIWGTMRLCDINRIAVNSFIMFWNVWVENGSVTSHGVLEPCASIIIRQSFDHRVEVDTFLGTGARWMMATSSKVCKPPQPTSSEKQRGRSASSEVTSMCPTRMRNEHQWKPQNTIVCPQSSSLSRIGDWSPSTPIGMNHAEVGRRAPPSTHPPRT
jgi:hypothetical protein